jgi:hypothetical protein
VPSGLAGFEHAPLEGSQVPAMWHGSSAPHTTGLDPAHTPAWHESVCVQALPSLHVVPLGAAGFEQVPVDGLHTPATWQASVAAHVTGFAPVHVPD